VLSDAWRVKNYVNIFCHFGIYVKSNSVLRVKSILFHHYLGTLDLELPLGRMQDLKQITSAQKITKLLKDVNIITKVFFVLKHEYILYVVITLVSLTKRVPSSSLTTLMFSIFYFIFLTKLIQYFLFTTVVVLLNMVMHCNS